MCTQGFDVLKMKNTGLVGLVLEVSVGLGKRGSFWASFNIAFPVMIATFPADKVDTARFFLTTNADTQL